MKIVVDVVNSDKVEKLTAEIEKQERAIVKWNSKMGSSTAAGVVVLQDRMEQAAVKIAHARTEIDRLDPSATAAGRGLQQLSYAVDDIQYGFAAIVNNIPQIIMGLGGGAGLAGAIGIAAVAINQLIKHWTEVTALFEAGFSNQSYDQLVKMKEAAEAASDAFAKLAKENTEWEDKSIKEVKRVVANAGAEKLRTVITGVLGAEGEGAEMTDDEKRAAKSVQNAKPEVKKGVMDRIQKRLQEENAEEAERIVGGLMAGGEKGEKARSRLTHLIENNPAPFDQLHPDFRSEFLESHPDKMEDKKKKEDFEKEEKKLQTKEDHLNRERWQERRRELEEEKRLKIQGLEDERAEVVKAQHTENEAMWQRQHQDRTPGQIMQGARAATDYYQGSSRSEDDPKVLAKKAHEQREKQLAVLKSMDENIKKERRLTIPH